MTDEDGLVASWVEPKPDNRSFTPFLNVKYTTTTARAQKSVEVVHCHKGWLVALLLGSGILMLASLVPAAVRLFAKGPKYKLPVSTAVRAGCYVEAPAGGSALDSARRARLLKDLRVKLGDVMPLREVGHLAVASLGGRVTVDKVRSGRIYD